jgi:large subunit ribosomal protein L25
MEKLLLNERELKGKKVKQLRAQGIVPAVVYNSKGDSKNVSMSATDANWILRNATSTSIIDSQLGKESFKVVVKELDIHPVTEQINHISLFHIDENASMIFTIPFHITGVCPAVKNNLGVLVNVLDSIEVRCTLKNLIPYIEIDISNLNHPGETISLNDITFPKGISLVNQELQDATIITITEPQKIEETIIKEDDSEEEEDVDSQEQEEKGSDASNEQESPQEKKE